jgi:hypothetical protein
MLVAALALTLTTLPPLVTAEGVTLEENGAAPWSAPPIGIQLDVGVPDGIGASLVYTPGRYLRLLVGGLSNGVGAGVRAGAQLVAFPTSIFRPLLSVDAGWVFGGQLAWLPPLLDDEVARKAISGMTVGFANVQLGFELGSKHFAVTLRAGLSYVELRAPSQSYAAGGASTLTLNGLSVTGFVPSARLGLLFSFG